jgi:hypothetical protein
VQGGTEGGAVTPAVFATGCSLPPAGWWRKYGIGPRSKRASRAFAGPRHWYAATLNGEPGEGHCRAWRSFASAHLGSGSQGKYRFSAVQARSRRIASVPRSIV